MAMVKEGGLRTKGLYKAGTAGRPLVSIITIVYNGEKYLEQTIQSVCRQTYSPIEYIIVDGGSTDNSLAIIQKHKECIDYWLSESDKGISDAFNKGIRLATGEWIGIINADDWYEVAAVERMLQKAAAADVVYGNLQCWEDNCKSYLFSGNHRLLHLEMTVNHPTVFVRKAMYDKWGLFDHTYKIAMDYELLLRMYVNGARFVYLDECLAHMRLEGVSDRRWINGFREVKRAKNIYLKNKPFNNIYFAKQVVFTFLSRKMNEAGKKNSFFARTLALYRKKFALVRKSRT